MSPAPSMAEYIARLLEAAPPISESQALRLGILLTGAATQSVSAPVVELRTPLAEVA